MEIKLPEINTIIKEIIEVESKFDGNKKKIKDWVNEHRLSIKNNNLLIKNKSEKNDIKILLCLLRDLLVRAMRGEMGMKTFYELEKSIKNKNDLYENNYREILKHARYRWGSNVGSLIISSVVNIFENKYKWDWKIYFKEAKRYYLTNFQDDKLLAIKGIGFKVRDLALSNFNDNYIANDLHVVRVMTRMGILNYGFDLLKDKNLEMGNNPGNEKNYLFLHKLILKLSDLTNNKYSPTDLDRIFWHLGKSLCGSKPKCAICPINKICLMGKNITNDKNFLDN